jgi:arginyl-tRNA synthetase
MAKDKFKQQFAEAAAAAFKAAYPAIYMNTGDEQVFSEDFVYDNLEQPKDPKMGRFAFPVFRYSKLLGQKPPLIATRVATEIGGILNRNLGPVLVSPSAAGGFVNAQVDFVSLAAGTLEDILTLESGYGGSERGNNQ